MKHIPLASITVSAALLTFALATPEAAANPAGVQPVPELHKAPSPKRHSINVNPLGVLTGSYNLNYEHLFDGGHGVIAEGAFSRYSGSESESVGLGANLGYRWHWRGKQNSGFLGVTAGYSFGSAEASKNNMDPVDFDVRVLSLTGNIGKRWAWDNGLNVTFRLGGGYGNWDVSTDSNDPDAKELAEDVDDILRLIPIALEGELSLGYMF